jgi:hypothetical protein
MSGRRERETWLTVRHHPILLLGRTWLAGLLMLCGATAIVVLATAPGRAEGFGFALILWVGGLVFLAGGLWAIREYLLWSADLLHLAEHRLVLASGIPSLSERRRELRFDRVETVELDQRSLLMRWCGCADLVITVAGGPPLRFAAACDPITVRDYLAAYLRQREQLREADDASAIRSSVERIVLGDDTPLLPEAATGSGRRAPERLRSGVRGQPLLYFGKRIEGEVWQRHRWFLVRAWCAPLALLACACAVPFAVDWLGIAASQGQIGFVTLAGVIAALVWLAWAWGNWSNDYYVVTPERLIAIDQMPLGLRQQITEASLDKVQDIAYRIPHPWAMLLGYGDVTVNTASDSRSFVLRGIARPRQLADQLDRHVAARRLDDQQARHEAIRSEFARWLTTYDEVLTGE